LLLNQKINPKLSYVFICFNEPFIYRFESTHKEHFIKDGYLFDKKAWKLSYLKTILSNQSSAYFTLKNNFRQMQAKFINFGAKESESFTNIYLKNNDMHNPAVFKRYLAMIDRFEKYCQKINAKPVYLYIPTADSFNLNKLLIRYGEDPEDYNADYYEKLIENYCIMKKRKFITLKPVLKEQYEKGEQLRFKKDGHFNKFANRIVGEYIYNEFFSSEEAN
jgi:hypothetical protein